MIVLERLCHEAVEQLCIFDMLDESDAHEFIDQLLNAIVARLRRDRRWSNVSHTEFDLLLADTRERFSSDLAKRIGGHAPVNAIGQALRDAVDEIEIGRAP